MWSDEAYLKDLVKAQQKMTHEMEEINEKLGILVDILSKNGEKSEKNDLKTALNAAYGLKKEDLNGNFKYFCSDRDTFRINYIFKTQEDQLFFIDKVVDIACDLIHLYKTDVRVYSDDILGLDMSTNRFLTISIPSLNVKFELCAVKLIDTSYDICNCDWQVDFRNFFGEELNYSEVLTNLIQTKNIMDLICYAGDVSPKMREKRQEFTSYLKRIRDYIEFK